MKKTRLLEIIREEISDALNEVPDFGGKLDTGVSQKYGEENTLQSAVDAIVDETLKDEGITKEDLKKDAEKAKEVLKTIRSKVLGRKNLPQDPRVKDALEKQQDIEVDTLGGISGKDLQQNQTNNALKKALGLITPKPRGRKADPNKPKKEKSTGSGKRGRPAGSAKTATRTTGDDGFDDVTYSDDEETAAATKSAGSDETAKKLGATPEEKKKKFNMGLKFVKKFKDDKPKIDAYMKKAKEEYKLTQQMLDDLNRAAGRGVE